MWFVTSRHPPPPLPLASHRRSPDLRIPQIKNPNFLSTRRRSIAAMERLSASARLMIVSDLDHTMVDHQDEENLALLRFNALWESEYRHDSLLVFSTGRSPTLYRQLRGEKPMLTPDVSIMSVGTEITYGVHMVPDIGWERFLDEKWDRGVVVEEASKFPQLSFQPETEQRPHKVSFHVGKGHAEEVTTALLEHLKKRGLDVKIIYSGGMDLDVLPQGAGKGQALAYLHRKLKSDGKLPVNTLVCGDSGNDAELFTIADVHGVMVSNAQDELLRWHKDNAMDNPKIIHATERCAAGIIEAIRHFNLGPSISPRDVRDFSTCKLERSSLAHEVVMFYLLYERWRRAEVAKSDPLIQNLMIICYSNGNFVHPSGIRRDLRSCIEALRPCYGDKHAVQFRVWVDRVSASHVANDTWLVKFDKWESSAEGRYCCSTTLLVNSKDGTRDGLVLMSVHQEWREGHAASDQNAWIF